MAKIGVLLTLGPFQFENSETAVSIAEAALDKGHEVQMFLYLDGVLNPIKHQTFPDLAAMPKDRFAGLVARGAKIIACGICVNARGLEKGKEYIEGVKVGGLPDFAEIVGEVDRLVKL
ncbi:MAG: DsrE family protein [Dehalococcoidia bacterium]|nr:DsrE family protein [Dehalococcoidia bacterium]